MHALRAIDGTASAFRPCAWQAAGRCSAPLKLAAHANPARWPMRIIPFALGGPATHGARAPQKWVHAAARWRVPHGGK